MKSEIVNPPCLKVILLVLFLDVVSSCPANNVSTRVALMFSRRMKIHVFRPLGCSWAVTKILTKLRQPANSSGIYIGQWIHEKSNRKRRRERKNEWMSHLYLQLEKYFVFRSWDLCKCCCTMCKLVWEQLQRPNEQHLWWSMLPATKTLLLWLF